MTLKLNPTSLDDLIEVMKVTYPTLFESRKDCLKQLFCVINVM
jgi:hypothetical protein